MVRFSINERVFAEKEVAMKITRLKHHISLKLMRIGEILYLNDKKISIREAIIKEIPEGKRNVLDMCSGTGQNAIQIAVHKTESLITAIDISSAAIEITKKRILRKNIDNVVIKRMDACRTAFREKEFDCIWISLVLHELEEKYSNKMINEAKRIIKDNGFIIVTEWLQPKSYWDKAKFFLLYLIEPARFREFMKIDLKKFLEKFELTVAKQIKSKYTITYFCRSNY